MGRKFQIESGCGVSGRKFQNTVSGQGTDSADDYMSGRTGGRRIGPAAATSAA